MKTKKNKYPVNAAQFERRQKRMREDRPYKFLIPAILTFECEMVVEAYYGGKIRAGWHMIWNGVCEFFRGNYWSLVWWISDKIGWTVLRPIMPNSDACTRHGSKCQYLNCNDMHCIEKSVPKWYRRITGACKYELPP